MKKKNIFKGLHLDRDKLPEYINEFCQNTFAQYNVSEISQMSGPQHRCEIVGDGKEFLVDFYFNGDGTTTIQPKVGKNQDTSLKLATEILTKLQYKGTDTRGSSYSVSPIEKEDVSLVIEYLSELEGVELVNRSCNTSNKYELFQFKSKIGDKITLKYYENKRFQIQGKPLYLYQEVTCLLSGYFPFDEMIKKQSEFFSVDIDPKEVRTEMQELLPNAYAILDETLRKILSASLAYRNIDIQLEDYSSFVFPALRVLEGYLKVLLGKKGVRVGKKFDMFDHNGKTFELNLNTKDTIGCTKTITAVESLYNYYNANRHGLFHVETVTSATRIIKNKETADSIINEVLSLIEDTYSDIMFSFTN